MVIKVIIHIDKKTKKRILLYKLEFINIKELIILSKKRLAVLIVLLLSVFSLLLGAVWQRNERKMVFHKKEPKIALLKIEGPIVGGSAGGLISAAGSDNLLKQLHELTADKEIRAVLLRINSPGGSSAASEEIYRELLKVKASGKKIVVSMGDTCASGGYLIACSADKIVANPSTLTGSIGVILPLQNVEELMKKIGVKNQAVKSSEHKDMGSGSRPMTLEEKKIFQAMVDDIYQQFVNIVVKGRNLPRAEVLKLADGRVYTGRQAKDLGLVDELGNYYDALDLTRKTAGLSPDAEVLDYTKKSPWDYLD